MGEAVRDERLRKGMTQRQLAERAGVTQPVVSLAERGADMRVSTLQQLAAALDLVPLLVPRRAVPMVRNVIASMPE
jgi:transcriptional regulator with XRE-family HTH domain